jgi:hypothetical protein
MDLVELLRRDVAYGIKENDPRRDVVYEALNVLHEMRLQTERENGEEALEELCSAYHAVITSLAERYEAAKASGDHILELAALEEVSMIGREKGFSLPMCALVLNQVYKNHRIDGIANESARVSAQLIQQLTADEIMKRPVN